MKIRLGYACLSTTITETASSMVTYTHYKKLGDKKGSEKLNNVIMSNFTSLQKLLDYNIKNDILFYRMTANLIPLGTHPEIKFDFNKYKNDFKIIGDKIKQNNLRVDIHISEYCVLNSINEKVVKSSINMLEFYQKMYEYMDIDSNLILHIGAKTNGKKESMNRFIKNFDLLNEKTKKLIVIENDDKVYNIRNTLKICNTLSLPMVLDYHHFMCNKNNEKIEDYIEKIFETWKNKTPKIHFSSPKSKKEFRAHNDYINVLDFIKFIEKIKFINKDFDIMIEAKMKDSAMFKLIRELKYYGYEIKGTTIYIK